jgi:lipopolysaccharide heptosyltransferase II
VLKVLVDVKFRDVLSRMPCVDDVITCDLKGRDRGKGFLRLLASLRKESFDISVDLQNNRKSHIAAFLAAIPRRYGFDNGKLSCLLNFKASMPSERMGPVEHQGRVLALMGIDIKDKSLELPISEEDRQWAKKFLRDNWPKKDQRIVALSLSASLKWQTKNWGVDQFAKLADMLARRSGTRTLIIGSGEDERTAREFISKTMSKPINAVGKTSIPRLAALMGECDALVTGDSAPMHVAAAGGLPFVALFGPTDPERHIPPGCEYRLIRKELKCSPCYKNVCLRARKCMRSISPEEVYKTLEELVFCGKAGGRRQEA